MNMTYGLQNRSFAARRQNGLSLVEILVSLVISLILVAGIIQLFVGSKQTYRFHEGLSRIQENGRFAVELLAKDIRSTGYYGCLSSSTGINNIDNTLNSSAQFLWNYGQAIFGFESTGTNTWNPTLDSSVASPLSGSDVITVRGGADSSPVNITNHGGGTSNVTVPANSGFQVGDILAASNCQSLSVFQVTGVIAGPPVQLEHATTGQTPGNARVNLADNYAAGELMRAVAGGFTKTYYLRTGAGGMPALWRMVGPNAAEIVEGVERMEILYGVCTGQGAARSVNPAVGYVTANNVTDWGAVCSVRVNLLLVSLENNLTSNAQTVVFPADTGNAISINDRRLRQAFSTTVGIRNRLP
jgi:type IV pilus assembly protein PilW